MASHITGAQLLELFQRHDNLLVYRDSQSFLVKMTISCEVAEKELFYDFMIYGRHAGVDSSRQSFRLRCYQNISQHSRPAMLLWDL